MLTKTQLKKIEEIVRKRILSFKYETLGERALTIEELELLKRAGLIRDSVRNFVGDAYTLGKIAQRIDRALARDVTYEQVLRMATKLPTTTVEKKAIQYSKDHVGEYITKLSDDMVRDVRTVTASESMSALRAVQNEVADAVLNRKTTSQLKTKLFEVIDDKNRDWLRVAATEMQSAIQNGIYQDIQENMGSDQLVYKRPAPDACKHCNRLHLTEEGVPRIFKLSDLEQTNVGKKAALWDATVGPVHPYCFTAGHRVLTKRGDIPVEDIAEGDLVWTHRGRWRKVQRTSKRWYDGKIVVINDKLRTTPEHPYAVSGRWVPASELAEGDNLSKVIREKVVLEKADNKPSMFGEIGEFVGVLFPFPFRRMPVSTMNLNGEHLVINGNINVVFENSLEGSDGDAFLRKSLDELRFKGGVVFRSLDLLCLRYKNAVRDLCSSPHLVGFFRNGFSVFNGGVFMSQELCMTSVPWIKSKFNKSGPDCGTGKIELFANLKDRFFRIKHFRKFDGVDNFFIHGYTKSVIVKISQEEYRGNVYNFSVQEDESYVCEGILNHNCQCQLFTVPKGFDFVKKPVAATPLEFDGKKYKAGMAIPDDKYRSMPEEMKQKTRMDAVMEFTGTTAKLSKALDYLDPESDIVAISEV